jgi:hypothetical protein
VIQTVACNQAAPPNDNKDEVPDIQVDEDSDNDDDDDNNNGNYWQPNHVCCRWAPNPRYFGDDFQTQTSLQPQDGYEALLQDFGLLTDEEAFLANLGLGDASTLKIEDTQQRQMKILILLALDEEGLLTSLHPLAFATKANNEDTPNYSQAMNGPDALGLMEAMEKEMQQLEEKEEPWDVIPISSIPEGANIIDSTWAFKRKRFPDGRVQNSRLGGALEEINRLKEWTSLIHMLQWLHGLL